MASSVPCCVGLEPCIRSKLRVMPRLNSKLKVPLDHPNWLVDSLRPTLLPKPSAELRVEHQLQRSLPSDSINPRPCPDALAQFREKAMDREAWRLVGVPFALSECEQCRALPDLCWG